MERKTWCWRVSTSTASQCAWTGCLWQHHSLEVSLRWACCGQAAEAWPCWDQLAVAKLQRHGRAGISGRVSTSTASQRRWKSRTPATASQCSRRLQVGTIVGTTAEGLSEPLERSAVDIKDETVHRRSSGRMADARTRGRQRSANQTQHIATQPATATTTPTTASGNRQAVINKNDPYI